MDDYPDGPETWPDGAYDSLGPNGLSGAMAFFVLKEAIASTALEHAIGCPCDVCLAAHGDKEAFLRVWLQTQ
jgi:hypothetical protein